MGKRRGLPKVIVFFGSDGAGKTTQANYLLEYLYTQKCRPKLAWIRGRHLLAFVLAYFFVKLGYRHLRVGGKQEVFDPNLLPRLKALWGVIELTSVIPWALFRVHLPRLLGYTVVAERYLVDTVVYLSYWLGEGYLHSFGARLLLGLIPAGSMLFHFDADTRVLLERAKDDVVTEDFIIFQHRVYLVLARMLGAITIDTAKYDKKEAFQRIVDALNVEKGRFISSSS